MARLEGRGGAQITNYGLHTINDCMDANSYANARVFLEPLGRVRGSCRFPGSFSFSGTIDRATGLSSKVKRSYSDAI